MRLRRPAHFGTTAQLGALYPFVASGQLPGERVVVGRDHFGGVFVHDPFELYAAGLLTNPNMVVLGQIGRGKSAFVKAYLYRQAAFGRRIVVLDPKGEYGPLARALGFAPIRLEPGGAVCLNPLELAGADGLDPDEALRRRLALLVAVAASAVARVLRPIEHVCLEAALRSASAGGSCPTLTSVVEMLRDPDSAGATAVALSRTTLKDEGRDLAFELRRFVYGELRSMFDGPTSPGVDLTGAVVVLDLAALYNSSALGTLITCAAAALEATWRELSTKQTILVIDEAWAVLSNLGAARFFQATFKLARAHGLANIAVVHRVSDLASVGSRESAAVRLAEGLLADSETLVCYAQSPAEIEAATEVLHLERAEARLLTGLPRGVALWRVGTRRFLVEHRLTRAERPLVDTDAHLRAERGADDAREDER